MKRFPLSFYFFAVFTLLILVLSSVSWAGNEGSIGSESAAVSIIQQDYNSKDLESVWEVLQNRIAKNPHNLFATLIFACAVIHTFFTNWFTALSHKVEKQYIETLNRRGQVFERGRDLSFKAEILHFLGEVEVVFGLWAIPQVFGIFYFYNWNTVLNYLNSRHYTEPMFVVVVMTLAATKPILRLAEQALHFVAKIGGGTPAAWWLTLMTLGPLLGSLITEAAAMTITALLMGKQFYAWRPSSKFAYATLGLLFVNISVGGVLTNFAAPPVVIVSAPWEWDSWTMFSRFGWKALLGIVVANLCYFWYFRKEFNKLREPLKLASVKARIFEEETEKPIPLWITLVHVALLVWAVWHIQDPVIFISTFLFFLGFYQATLPHQRPLNLRTPILVGFFISGLIIHGGLQTWWITPLLSNIKESSLLVVVTMLAAVNDNTAITYLASLIPNLSESFKYIVMAGAVAGGGLTMMANAPNPAGALLLGRYFKNNISPLKLLGGAILPTIIMALVFFFINFPPILSFLME